MSFLLALWPSSGLPRMEVRGVPPPCWFNLSEDEAWQLAVTDQAGRGKSMQTEQVDTISVQCTRVQTEAVQI